MNRHEASTTPLPALEWSELVELPTAPSPPSERIALSQGQSLDVERRASGDRLTVRGLRGEVTLRVVLTDEGPILSFQAADLAIEATRSLRLAAEHVAIGARRSMSLTTGEDMDVRVGGRRHTRVEGRDLTEASAVETQANDGDVVLRAREDVRVDAEHIGLNDDPCPGALPWTKAAGEEGGA